MISTSLIALSAAALAQAATHYVTVGGTGDNVLKFQPEFVAAEIGDIVEFQFRQKNHTVTRTSFGNVCHPLIGADYEPVFNTGFQPVGADQTDSFPTAQYHVTTTDPLWFYCAQNTHCGKGMVFSINCPYDGPNSFENFKNSALDVGRQADQQAAASSSWAATATSEVYGGQTYAPVYHPTVTATVTLGDEVWTTTYESYANSPNPTPAAPEGVEHRVIVGADGGLTYDPPAIAAAPRDRIVFEFRAKNHTATQSAFSTPCRKLESTSLTGQVGFDSGFMPVPAGATDGSFPTYTVTVNDTAPIWVYCRQGNHCGAGMVFSVNADETSDRNSAAFQSLAKVVNGSSTAPSPTQSGTVTGSGAVSLQAGAASVALLAIGSLFVLAL